MSVATYTDGDGNEIEITPTTEWVNYGDADPLPHGGVFIRFEPDNDMWHIVKTQNGDYLPHIDDCEIMITEYWADLQDLFANGDPDNGPSEYLQREIETLSNVPNFENALVDYDIEYFLWGLARWRRDRRPHHVHESDYWDELALYDIPTEKFK